MIQQPRRAVHGGVVSYCIKKTTGNAGGYKEL